MPANILETLIGWGFKKQTDIAPANLTAGIWGLGKLNAELPPPRLNTEDYAEEMGKGHEFATQNFKTFWDTNGRIEKYLSSDFAAWAMAFALGKVVKSGTTPNFTYTCTPLNGVTDGIELPYFSYIEQIRPAAPDVLAPMAAGGAMEGWRLPAGS